MGEELTKELLDQYIHIKDTEQKINRKCHEIVQLISTDIKELFTNGKFSIAVNMTEDKQIAIVVTVKDKVLERHLCKYDIFYDKASLSIELRNLKDTLYDARKVMEKDIPKTFWQKIFG